MRVHVTGLALPKLSVQTAVPSTDTTPLPDPLKISVSGTCRSVNVASTARAAVITTAQPDTPVQSPLTPSKDDPETEAAVIDAVAP